MSLQSRPIRPVPEETARAAKAAFPRGNRYLTLRDELGSIYTDADFAELYPRRGQPAYPPWRLALVTVFQYMENLSDRKAAEAVRARLDWKYALGLELTDPGFDHSVLCEFRRRLLRGEAGTLLLDRILERLAEVGLVKARGRQRTDSTYVLAAIRELNRLELLGETMRAALNELATADRAWTQRVAQSEWYDRYSRRVEDARLPESKAKRTAWAETVGQDGFALLEALQHDAGAHLRDLPKVRVLQIVWAQHLERTDGTVHLAERRGGKKKSNSNQSNSDEDDSDPDPSDGSGSVESPYDPEARYCRRDGTAWTGYRVHLTETCDRKRPRIVTHVETTEANVHEARCTRVIQKGLAEKDLSPNTHLADAAYVSAGLLTESWRQWRIRLLGPPRKNPTWQAKTPGAFTHDDFEVDWDRQTVTCPEGKQSSSWRSYETSSGTRIRASFRESDCKACPARSRCTTAVARHLALRPREEYEALLAVRALMKSDEGRRIYALRAGVEGTISQGVRRCGLRRSRYWGREKTHLRHVATAAALNLMRISAWLDEVPVAETRTSRFARLAP
jgi:transposase